MTDEEKAEEYVNTHCCYKRQDFIRTYLDGLTEGKPKRHDLREDPNDLPKECEEVLAVYSNTYGEKGLLTDKIHLRNELAQYYFEEEIGEWLWVKSGTDDDIHKVIAWCELPQFEG